MILFTNSKTAKARAATKATRASFNGSIGPHPVIPEICGPSLPIEGKENRNANQFRVQDAIEWLVTWANEVIGLVY